MRNKICFPSSPWIKLGYQLFIALNSSRERLHLRADYLTFHTYDITLWKLGIKYGINRSGAPRWNALYSRYVLDWPPTCLIVFTFCMTGGIPLITFRLCLTLRLGSLLSESFTVCVVIADWLRITISFSSLYGSKDDRTWTVIKLVLV